MKKTIEFKNINWGNFKGWAKINIELKGEAPKQTLSITGEAYTNHASEPFAAGQCLDTIAESSLKDNPLFIEIHDYWKKYHLNDMHAGTPAQEALIQKGIESHQLINLDYISTCAYLESKNMLYDGDYKYGTAWLFEPIPNNILKRLEEIIQCKINNIMY